MNHIARQSLAILTAAVSVSAASAAFAQDWPVKPVRLIAPVPPGGPADIAARVVSQKLTERLKQTVIVENRAGAAGNIGMEAASKAAPDGYTFLYAMTALVTNPFTHKLNFDPVKDFAPVSRVAGASFVLVSNPAFPPRSVAEIVALARSKPKEVTCAHAGSLPQIGCEMLRTLARIDITSVPYKGQGPALNDVAAGQVHLIFDVQISATAAVRAGRVRPIATANARRGVGPFGDLPTMAETLPGFELDGWHGIMAPAGTPRDIVLRMNQEVRGVLSDEETRKRFNDAGMQVMPTSPEEFGDLVQRDRVKYEKVTREAGIKPE